MPIADDWFVDYQNKVVVHATTKVDYSGTGGFTAGETATWSGGQAIVVSDDTDADDLNLVYITGTPSGIIFSHGSGRSTSYFKA